MKLKIFSFLISAVLIYSFTDSKSLFAGPVVTSPDAILVFPTDCTNDTGDDFYGSATVLSYSTSDSYTCTAKVQAGDGTNYYVRFLRYDEDDPDSIINDLSGEEDEQMMIVAAGTMETACSVLEKAKEKGKNVTLSGSIYSCHLPMEKLIVLNSVGIGDSVAFNMDAHALSGVAEGSAVTTSKGKVQHLSIYPHWSPTCMVDIEKDSRYYEGDIAADLAVDFDTISNNDLDDYIDWAKSYCDTLIDAQLGGVSVDLIGVVTREEYPFFADVAINAVRPSSMVKVQLGTAIPINMKGIKNFKKSKIINGTFKPASSQEKSK